MKHLNPLPAVRDLLLLFLGLYVVVLLCIAYALDKRVPISERAVLDW